MMDHEIVVTIYINTSSVTKTNSYFTPSKKNPDNDDRIYTASQ